MTGVIDFIPESEVAPGLERQFKEEVMHVCSDSGECCVLGSVAGTLVAMPDIEQALETLSNMGRVVDALYAKAGKLGEAGTKKEEKEGEKDGKGKKGAKDEGKGKEGEKDKKK